MPNYLSADNLAGIVSNKHRITKKESREVINLIFSTIADRLRDGTETWIPLFGKFYAVQKPERMVMNPRVGRMMLGAPKVVPRVRWSGKVVE